MKTGTARCSDGFRRVELLRSYRIRVDSDRDKPHRRKRLWLFLDSGLTLELKSCQDSRAFTAASNSFFEDPVKPTIVIFGFR